MESKERVEELLARGTKITNLTGQADVASAGHSFFVASYS
jgi:hypothetical protein